MVSDSFFVLVCTPIALCLLQGWLLLGVFWIRPLVGVRRCLSSAEGRSLISLRKQINGKYEAMPLAA